MQEKNDSSERFIKRRFKIAVSSLLPGGKAVLICALRNHFFVEKCLDKIFIFSYTFPCSFLHNWKFFRILRQFFPCRICGP